MPPRWARRRALRGRRVAAGAGRVTGCWTQPSGRVVPRVGGDRGPRVPPQPSFGSRLQPRPDEGGGMPGRFRGARCSEGTVRPSLPHRHDPASPVQGLPPDALPGVRTFPEARPLAIRSALLSLPAVSGGCGATGGRVRGGAPRWHARRSSGPGHHQVTSAPASFPHPAFSGRDLVSPLSSERRNARSAPPRCPRRTCLPGRVAAPLLWGMPRLWGSDWRRTRAGAPESIRPSHLLGFCKPIFLEPTVGLEPATGCLQNSCSAN